MSKLMKTVGKFKLWTILGVLVIAAGILIGAVSDSMPTPLSPM